MEFRNLALNFLTQILIRCRLRIAKIVADKYRMNIVIISCARFYAYRKHYFAYFGRVTFLTGMNLLQLFFISEIYCDLQSPDSYQAIFLYIYILKKS